MVFGAPKYPVKNPAPDLGDCVAAMRPGDIVALAGITTGSTLFGWFVGKPVRPQTASTAGALGFTAGFMYAYQNAYGRLMGYTQ
mmetsp:Transcript_25794/g.57830  ORF Transcript_25794/g.57830 Transcript_25794/m.57830 type:complete len:84 (-) Transcript_25794:236-487(-)